MLEQVSFPFSKEVYDGDSLDYGEDAVCDKVVSLGSFFLIVALMVGVVSLFYWFYLQNSKPRVTPVLSATISNASTTN